jgi:hypothetical protein
MSITKQLLINKHLNKIGVGYDISNEIKSYCFYDIVTWRTMNHIRQSKNTIHNLINHSCISRNNPHDFYEDNEEKDEHWVFWIYEGDNIQFQSMNCHKCGNYRFTNTNVFPNSIRCFCLNDDDDVPPLIDMETGLWVFE